MVRFITKSGSRSHVGQIERSQINTLVLMIESNFIVYVMPARSFIILGAPYLNDNFVRVSEVHRYNTRNSSFYFQITKSQKSCFFHIFQLCKT